MLYIFKTIIHNNLSSVCVKNVLWAIICRLLHNREGEGSGPAKLETVRVVILPGATFDPGRLRGIVAYGWSQGAGSSRAVIISPPGAKGLPGAPPPPRPMQGWGGGGSTLWG